MIEKNGISENAFEIKSKSYTVRTLKVGDKTMFAASDILSACGVKAPTKWLDRNAYHRPDMTLTKLHYPVKTAKGYRRVEMFFVSAAVGKKLIKATSCPDETERWLLEEVLTYKADSNSTALEDEFQKYGEWADSLWRNMQKNESAPEDDINQRIDKILIELLEIKKCVLASSSRT
jgi:hypothetical protein